MYIDTHFHTNVYERYENAVELALNQMVQKKILAVSNTVDVDSYKSTLELAKRSDFVLPCFGLHPQVAPEFIANIDELNDLFENALIFGEIGLDHYHMKNEAEYPAQEKLLRKFFDYAQKQKKIVILHLDGAEERGLEIIQTYKLKRIIVHGYWGNLTTFKKMVDEGIYFSIGGNAIMPKFKPVIDADDLKRVYQIVREIPPGQLLVETDGPCRTDPNASPDGPRSSPYYIKEIIDQLAILRDTSAEQINQQALDNFLKITKKDSQLAKYHSLILNNR